MEDEGSGCFQKGGSWLTMLFEFEEKELSHSVFQETPDVTFGCESGKLLDGVGASRGRESSQQTVGDFIMLKMLITIKKRRATVHIK